ncbi:MAG: PP2C family protein-serine/threonine phosphatase [Rudaea sp.]
MSGGETATLDVTSASVTAIGGRSANEDALGQVAARCGTCYVISDGAGGHVGGAVASRLVVDSVIEEVERAAEFSTDVIERAFARAQARVAERQGRDASVATMSATVAALLVDPAGRRAVWGHLGDSRILHFRQGVLHSVTRDHSLVQRLVDAGFVSASRAADHPNRNVLYGALGAEGDTKPTLEREPVALRDGDAFLLCTDGFWGRIGFDAIEERLRFCTNVNEWLESMRNAVADGLPPGADNYTAVGVWIGSPAEVTVSKPAGNARRIAPGEG